MMEKSLLFKWVIFLLWAYKADHSQHWLIVLHKSQKGQKKYHSTFFLIIFYGWLLAFSILSFPIIFSSSQESLCSPPTGVYHDEIKAAKEKIYVVLVYKKSFFSPLFDRRYKPYNLERGKKKNKQKPTKPNPRRREQHWRVLSGIQAIRPPSLSFVPLSVMLRNRRPLKSALMRPKRHSSLLSPLPWSFWHSGFGSHTQAHTPPRVTSDEVMVHWVFPCGVSSDVGSCVWKSFEIFRRLMSWPGCYWSIDFFFFNFFFFFFFAFFTFPFP